MPGRMYPLQQIMSNTYQEYKIILDYDVTLEKAISVLAKAVSEGLEISNIFVEKGAYTRMPN